MQKNKIFRSYFRKWGGYETVCYFPIKIQDEVYRIKKTSSMTYYGTDGVYVRLQFHKWTPITEWDVYKANKAEVMQEINS